MSVARGYSISTAVWLILGTATVMSGTYYYASRRNRPIQPYRGSTRRMSEAIQAVSLPRQHIPLARALGSLTQVAMNEEAKAAPPAAMYLHAQLPEKDTVDSLLKSFFNSAPSMPSLEWSPPSLPPIDSITMKVSELYNAFPDQIKSLKESYTRIWDLVTIDEFRQMMDEISKRNESPEYNPEILMHASVREGNTLSQDEQDFVEARKQKMVKQFAKFIGVDPEEVYIDDLPVVGVASSGGGFRAMIGSAGYLKAMEDTGALDCTMYMAAVSGSTWTLSQYLSSLTHGSLEELFAHLRTHAQTHVANIGHFVGMINSSPENAKASMQGAVQRYYQQNGSVSLVDIFGMLLGTVLLIKKETKTVEAKETDKSEDTKEVTPTIVEVDTMLPGTEQKISKQQKYVKDGSRPMPIYCLVRQGIHEGQVIVDNEESGKQLKEKAEEREKEVKADEEKSDAGGDSADDGRPTSNVTDAESENLVEKDISQERDMYQWFELTPFEVGSEELSAWIPTWAFGRNFEGGKSKNQVPELNLCILMGAFGSAFTATLAHIYQEFRSLLPASALQKADSIIEQYDQSVTTIHPISPASFSNPFYKISPTPPEATPENVRSESIIHSPNLFLMDAGMDNNIPFYPLLRSGRSVDVIITFDLSADIQTAPHFERAEGWAKRRGVLGWPIGAGWPKENIKNATEQQDGGAENIDMEEDKQVHGTKVVNETDELKEMKQDQKDAMAELQGKRKRAKYGLGHCTVFASSASETTMEGKGKNEADDNSGTTVYRDDINPITVVYFPLIGNDRYDPDYDPQENDITTTWNFVYSPDQVSKLHGLAETNWKENVDKVRQVLRAVWERKKKLRQKHEVHNIDDMFSTP